MRHSIKASLPDKPGLQLLHHDQAKVVLNLPLFPQRMDLKAIVSNRCKNVDSTRLHGWHRLVRKIAVVRIARFTFFTWPAAKRDDFVIIVQKQLSCHLHSKRCYNTHLMAAE